MSEQLCSCSCSSVDVSSHHQSCMFTGDDSHEASPPASLSTSLFSQRSTESQNSLSLMASHHEWMILLKISVTYRFSRCCKWWADNCTKNPQGSRAALSDGWRCPSPLCSTLRHFTASKEVNLNTAIKMETSKGWKTSQTPLKRTCEVVFQMFDAEVYGKNVMETNCIEDRIEWNRINK